METKILREISKKVQFRTNLLENGKKEYVVERKSSGTGEWEVIAKSVKIERALIKKHNAWLAQLHFMNLTNKLLRRRKYKKQTFLGIKVN